MLLKHFFSLLIRKYWQLSTVDFVKCSVYELKLTVILTAHPQQNLARIHCLHENDTDKTKNDNKDVTRYYTQSLKAFVFGKLVKFFN